MSKFRIAWEKTLVSEDNPLDVAKQCLNEIINKESLKFIVTNIRTGEVYLVDLSEEDENATILYDVPDSIVDKFIIKYCSKVREGDNTELMENNYYCIEWDGYKWWVPKDNIFYTPQDKELISFLNTPQDKELISFLRS